MIWAQKSHCIIDVEIPSDIMEETNQDNISRYRPLADELGIEKNKFSDHAKGGYPELPWLSSGFWYLHQIKL